MPSTPTNPQAEDGVPNEVFEALIGLLASDGIDDIPSTSAVPLGRYQVASQGGAPVGTVELDQQVLNSLGGGVQTGMVVDRRDSVEDAATLQAKPVTAIIQNSSPVRTVYPDVDDAIYSNNAPPGGCGKGRNMKDRKQQIIHKVESEDRINETGPQIAIEGSYGYGPMQDGDDSVTAEVAQLSEEEAKRALAAIASMINVRPSILLSGDLDSARFKLALCTRSNSSFQDISHALDVVERIDEIVWRRPSIPISSSLDPVFSAGNVDGLLSRLEHWDRMVRSSGV
ncbi:hypothetical protein EDC04DRAFT_2607780 [Pisolithus marmoratus]|nr:hypothetical protein EDC04DRAFT_2607780 [Pisolithus marmoratus]